MFLLSNSLIYGALVVTRHGVLRELLASSHASKALALVQAIENGAAAFLGPQIDDSSDPESSPLSVPVIQLPDPWEALGRLGAAFHNEPSQNMTVIGVTGEPQRFSQSLLCRCLSFAL